MNKRISKLLTSTVIIFCITIISCSKRENEKFAESIIINEMMASNRTGIINKKGKPADWIEIKNISSDSINLEGYGISVIRNVTDSVADDEAEEEDKIWTFPAVKIAGGECMLIVSGKDNETKNDGLLIADIKLPKKGGTVQLLTPKGKVIKELKYEEMKADRSLALQADSTYKISKWPSPGYENNKEGYVAASEFIDSQRKSPLLIWEVMNRAESNGNWVELKNISDKDVDLSEYSLAKKTGKDEGWPLPQRTLKPGEFITIQLSGKKANKGNPLQAPFKLGGAETVVLLKKGKFVDGINARQTVLGGSIGRKTGEKGLFYFSTPTKNAENTSEGKRFVAEKPEFDQKPGIYAKSDTVCIRLKNEAKVHYTLDGSRPTSASPVFKDSMLITKNTTLRTLTSGDSITLNSNVETSTYLVGADHSIPVMNITVNPGDLYNYSNGIYTEGPGYNEEFPHKGANYWKKWTKNAHVELFDGDDGFSVDCGLKIFGGFSRVLAKKSFTLKFGSKYGEPEVEYDFFDKGEPMELKELVLRSGSQDFDKCMLRDEFFTSLMQEQSPALLTQHHRPVVLYINGSYFGLYYMREKINKDFVSRKLNVPNDSINIIMSVYTEEGSPLPYKHLMNYVTNHDMTVPEHYEYVKNLVDLEGLIDFKLGQIYSGNGDTGNVRYVRSTHPKSDKKWHFIFYDLDLTWGGNVNANYYLSTGVGGNGANLTPHNIMISRLLRNKEFREMFLQRLSHHMKHTFTPENTNLVFNRIIEQIQPEMERNCERWPQLSYKRWEKNIEDFRKKFDKRHTDVLNNLRKHLSITEEENKKYFPGL